MGQLWARVAELQAKTITTTTGRAQFNVDRVTDTGIVITPHSTGLPRKIQRRELESAAGLGLTTDQLTPTRVRQAGASEFNPAYVAAILRAITHRNHPG
jgi:hypothetical protein